MKVWCLIRDQWSYIAPVAEQLAGRAEFVRDEEWDPQALVEARPDVVLCVNDWPAEVAACIDAARAAGIPSLVLQDGILEWRCQYENPLFGAGGGAPQHQPVLADRIACIGEQSARQIGAWGNDGRVEVTGMPRLDGLLERKTRPIRRPGTTVLVMTAKNPGFTEAQREVTLRSLRDLRTYLDGLPGVRVHWRVSRMLVAPLGIENRLETLGGQDLIEMIEAADAVITTPSTAMLEAMLLGRPVAVLDYHNVPRFVPSAWTIPAQDHIAQVVAELREPAPARMAFQEDCLRDCLRIDGPAAPRVAELLVSMARGDAPHAAANGAARTARLPDLAALYPGQPVFAETDVRALQVRAARLEKENEQLRERLRQRRLSERLYRLGRKAMGRMSG